MSLNTFMNFLFFFKEKTAYEIKECDWSSDVCSSDLGKLSANYLLMGSSKNWQVGDWSDPQHNIHQKWILKESPGVYSLSSSGTSFIDPGQFELHRSRHVSTDFSGNQTYTIDEYAIATMDGAWHWLSGTTPSGRLMTMDGSGIQVIVTAGSNPDRSNDTATVIFRDGTRYFLPNISVPMPAIDRKSTRLNSSHIPLSRMP